MNDQWLSRWESGQIGWHEAGGSSALRKFWPRLAQGSRVLVPLCGKSHDLLWLAHQGLKVTGVELSEIAAKAFFEDAGIKFEVEVSSGFSRFHDRDAGLSIVCGDYFQYVDGPFDALYDRAALVALPPELRPVYVKHTQSLLKASATQLLITLEYDQSIANGPPYSVLPEEVKGSWSRLRKAGELSAIDTMPPKFREAGVKQFVETVWVTDSA